MADRDFFYEIAKTKHPIDSADREVLPGKVSTEWIPETEKKFLSLMEPMGYEEQKKKFQEDLEALRKKYRPFLSDYFQAPCEHVERVEFKEFLFRYAEKEECFTERNRPEQAWETIKIPDYRGPVGKWNGYYKKEFSCPEGWKEKLSGHRIVLDFQCVDYIAEIYINGNFVGSHEGFFAPFSMDITKFIREENELIILCKNDMSILGEGEFLDGDKIYAATGPGWDDPVMGWHHCPAGAGVFGKVKLELRPELYLEDIFVRPDLKNHMAEIRIGTINYTDEVKKDMTLSLYLAPKNFQGEAIADGEFHMKAMGPGKNEYRYFLPLHNYRIWELGAPWLYRVGAVLKIKEQELCGKSQSFGLKSFISDETSEPKGKFYLNDQPIVLRGANEMGHLQQCVMQEDYEQLIDDILIAKLCNMNYYRITQRPVQEEIYDYFDMLGMMQQCDFPLFGFLRRPQFAEAIRQVGEMEHLVRKHVSTVMLTFINEPMCIRKTQDPNDKFSKRYEAKGHRHLQRDELEAFFAAARKAVYIENPDRVIKNVEGDYDGPTAEGMPDFHTYTMWYTNHGQPIGKLMRGYLPPVKEGWMIGCGEYGAEGLDPEDLMRRRYPKEWLKEDECGHWYPDKIIRSQTHSVQGDWYQEQDTMENWVLESQLHQARATKLMTDAFRRRADVINHTAIHLFIDAWPAGWMKTLLDCERTPKRAFFAYQEALIPLKINLYTGRTQVYEEEMVPVEVWLFNDTSKEEHLKIHAEVFEEGQKTAVAAFEMEMSVEAAGAKCAGVLPITFEKKKRDRAVWIQAAIWKEDGTILHQEKIHLSVYERKALPNRVYPIGAEAERFVQTYGSVGDEASHVYVACGIQEGEIKKIEEHVKSGGKAIWLLTDERIEALFDGKIVKTKGCGDLFFAAAEQEWNDHPISFLYNEEKGYIDSTAAYTIETELEGEDLFYTYAKQGFLGSVGAKTHLPFVKRCSIGKGSLILCTLKRAGRIGCNGGLDRLFLKLLEE